MQNQACREAGFNVYQDLKKQGLDVLLDERDERAGVKLKDADLIGIPIQIIIGEKNIQKGQFELKERATGKVELLRQEAILPRLSS